MSLVNDVVLEERVLKEVSADAAYFDIKYGDFSEGDNLVTIAKIGKDPHSFFLEWVEGVSTTDEIKASVLKKVRYSLIERSRESGLTISINTIWEYMQYHASGTAANLYGLVHWVYVER